MGTCRTCEHARQAGKKDQTDIVGCAVMTRGDISIYDVTNSNVYEGWMYSGRRPGDKSHADTLDKGCLLNGSKLVDSEGCCNHYELATRVFTDEGEVV